MKNQKNNRKNKYSTQGGYHSGKDPKNIKPNPPPTKYINPNNPNDFIYLDNYSQPPSDSIQYIDVPQEYNNQLPFIEYLGPPNDYYQNYPPPPMQDYNDSAEYEEEDKPKNMERIVKNDRNLGENRLKITWDKKMESIYDLLEIAYGVEKFNYTNISLNQHHLLNLQEPLKKLSLLIGMEKIKQNIFNQLVFFLQNIEPQFPHMLHTCIEGPPGCGKTELANILADIYANLGIIHEAKVVIARRSDLVAGFLGQTAQKTQDMIDSAKGGVLLIDEAYALGNEERKDSFAKECIDTLNQNLTEGKGEFICIIAGYKEDLEKSFFGFNSGLERRFPYRFSIEDYDHKQLFQIFNTILCRNNWYANPDDENKIIEFFKDHRPEFKFNGGDLENFVHFTKLAYAKNRIFHSNNNARNITINDIEIAFKMYIENKKKIVEKNNIPPQFMYN